jgi:phage/plasmid-like protein (TIGR03299 family)
MAHNIANIDGKDAMFTVGNREAAWHLLGQRTSDTVSWDIAMAEAGLDWQVKTADLFSRDTKGAVTKIHGHKSIWRDTNEPACLGVVGDGYTPIQNRHAFHFVDGLLEAMDGAHYESAGALGNGERIWCLAKLPVDIRIANTDDVSKSYLLFTNSHDGTSAGIAKLTSVRVVCQNTLSAALSDGGKVLRFKHTRNVHERMNEAREIMRGINSDVRLFNMRLNNLAAKRMTRTSMVAILDKLFPAPKVEASQTRRNNTVAQVLELFAKNDNDAIPEIRGSAYNMLNAVTEFTDHFRTVRNGDDGRDKQHARAEAALFGTGEKLKESAVAVIEAETKDNPAIDSIVDLRGTDSAEINELYRMFKL